MQYLMSYSMPSSNVDAASNRFLETQGAPPPDGVSLLGRWHAMAGRRGWMVIESDDVAAVHKYSRQWHDLLDFEIVPVIGDETIAQVMIEMRG